MKLLRFYYINKYLYTNKVAQTVVSLKTLGVLELKTTLELGAFFPVKTFLNSGVDGEKQRTIQTDKAIAN